MHDDSKYLPDRCPLCHARVPELYSNVRKDMPCAICGYYVVQATKLLAVVREILAQQLGVDATELTVDYFIGKDVGADSHDLVELIMDLEETIPPHLLSRSLTGRGESLIDSLIDATVGNVVRSYCRRAVTADI